MGKRGECWAFSADRPVEKHVQLIFPGFHRFKSPLTSKPVIFFILDHKLCGAMFPPPFLCCSIKILNKNKLDSYCSHTFLSNKTIISRFDQKNYYNCTFTHYPYLLFRVRGGTLSLQRWGTLRTHHRSNIETLIHRVNLLIGHRLQSLTPVHGRRRTGASRLLSVRWMKHTNMHVFRMWGETEVPEENPCMYMENILILNKNTAAES